MENDAEITALQKIIEILERLDEGARSRVAAYLYQRY